MDKRSFFFTVAITLASIIGLHNTSAADDVVKRAIGPSIVFVKGPEASGSGVVVRDEGLILTNANIIGDAKQVTIHATVTKSGRTTYKRFTASVKSRHPDYPVVMLQADVPEGCQMMRIKSAGVPPHDGQNCYAVGCAGDNRDTYSREFSEASLTSSEKLIKGKKYLELTTTVNPVNNGGAVADRDGQLLGILINQYRGAGYSGIAVGIRSVRPSEFIPEYSEQDPATAFSGSGEEDDGFPEGPETMEGATVQPDPMPDVGNNDDGQGDEEGFQAMMDGFDEPDGDDDFSIVGLIIIILGFLVVAVGRIWLLLVAYKQGCLWALGVFFVDVVALIFAIMHWDEAKYPFLMSIGGIILVIVGVFAGAA